MRHSMRDRLRRAAPTVPALILAAMIPVLLCTLVVPFFAAQELPGARREARFSAAVHDFCLPATNIEKPKHFDSSPPGRDLAPPPVDDVRCRRTRGMDVPPGLDDAPTLASLLVYTQTTSSSL